MNPLDWLKKLKIKTKITLGLLLIAAFIPIMGFATITNMIKVSDILLHNQNLLTEKDLLIVRMESYEKKIPGIYKMINDFAVDKTIKNKDKKIQALQALNVELFSDSELAQIKKFEALFIKKVDDIIKSVNMFDSETAGEHLKELLKEQKKYNKVIEDTVEKIDKSILLSKKNIDEAKKLSIATAIVLTIVGALVSLLTGGTVLITINNGIKSLTENIKEVSGGNFTVKNTVKEVNNEFDYLNALFFDMVSSLRELLTKVGDEADHLAKNITQINEATEQTSMGSEQLIQGITQISTGASDQSFEIKETLENLNNINKIIHTVAESADSTVKLSQGTEVMADSGNQQVISAVEKISEIKTKSEEIANVVNELGTLSAGIGEIVELIKSIASQTNLLALNAAIEAARAGQHGAGFAVVADEVKKLASQSSVASDDINKVIKEIQNKVNRAVSSMNEGVEEIDQGVSIVESAGGALSEILKSTKESGNQVLNISNEIKILADNYDAVVKVMESISDKVEDSAANTQEMSSVTQEQTASLEEIVHSSQVLKTIASDLQTSVTVFKVK